MKAIAVMDTTVIFNVGEDMGRLHQRVMTCESSDSNRRAERRKPPGYDDRVASRHYPAAYAARLAYNSLGSLQHPRLGHAQQIRRPHRRRIQQVVVLALREAGDLREQLLLRWVYADRRRAVGGDVALQQKLAVLHRHAEGR